MSFASDDELTLDEEVRLVPCRVCGVPAGAACDYGLTKNGNRRSQNNLSHVGRYRDARKARLVPAIPGVR